MYEIEKNVDLPKRRNRYPFGRMEVGDSFLVTDQKGMNGVSSAASSYAKVEGGKFRTLMRTMERDGESGVRVWRVA